MDVIRQATFKAGQFMSRHNGVQGNPVVLSIEPWLYGFSAAPGCGVCSALVQQFEKAETHEDKFDAAREIRNHPHPGK